MISIEEIPLPVIVIDECERIISHNQLLARRLQSKIVKGQHITTIFPVWELTAEDGVITAKHDDTSFIFKQGILHSGATILIEVENKAIASLKQENKELKNLTRELDAIIENSYDGIYITDNKGVTWKTNSAIERITGIPKEYYIGKNVNDLIDRGILKNSVTEKVLKHRRTVSVVQKNYKGKDTLLTGTPVFDDEGEIEKIVTNIRDLSDLNDLQAELRKANKLNDEYKKEISRLKNKCQQPDGIIINSEQMKRIYDTAKRVADVDATVLILVETGVGKDVLANYIYTNSIRCNNGKFIKINCGAIPPKLLESELFGYEAGAFTGADSKGKPGMFEIADKGILFLDEIGELPQALQVKLLRVLQEGEIQRVGGTRPKKVNVRIIAATNRNLQKMVANGEFREDLYYRLNVIPFIIPPLRERPNDILPMVHMFLNQVNDKYQMNKRLDYGLKDFFYSYNWPGNIRELANLIERLVVTAPEDIINIDYLPSEYRESRDTTIQTIVPLKEAAEKAEEKVLALAAEKYDSTYEIAEVLNTSQPTVVRKLKKYGLHVVV